MKIINSIQKAIQKALLEYNNIYTKYQISLHLHHSPAILAYYLHYYLKDTKEKIIDTNDWKK